MSWATIRAALGQRILSAVPTIDKVHDYIRWTEDTLPEAEFGHLYISTKTGQKVLHFWQITYTDFEDVSCLDSPGTFRRYNITIEGFYGHYDKIASERIFKETCVEPVAEAFRNGDSTFGGIVNGMSDLKFEVPRGGASFKGVACHFARGTFKVEEGLPYTPTGSVVQNPYPEGVAYPPFSPTLCIPVTEVMDALLATVRTATVGYVVPTADRVYLQKGVKPATVYPLTPYTELPRIFLVDETDSAIPTALFAGGVTEAEFVATFYLQIQQQVGVDHQRVLLNAMQRIRLPFLGNFNPAQIQAVPGFAGYGREKPGMATIVEKTLPEINHPFDDPNLKISLGSVQMRFSLRFKAH